MTETVQEIETDELKALLDREAPQNNAESGGYALLNVLPPEHFRGAHIPGSMNIPANDATHFPQHFAKDKQLIVYSASQSCEFAEQAVQTLTGMGFTNVVRYRGGLNAWKMAGHPVEQDG